MHFYCIYVYFQKVHFWVILAVYYLIKRVSIIIFWDLLFINNIMLLLFNQIVTCLWAIQKKGIY